MFLEYLFSKFLAYFKIDYLIKLNWLNPVTSDKSLKFEYGFDRSFAPFDLLIYNH